MTTGQKIEKEALEAQPKSDPSMDLIEHNKVHGKDVNSSYSLSSSSQPHGATTYNNDHEEVTEQGVPCPPTNVHSSSLGYDGSYDTWKGQGQNPSQEKFESVQTEGSSVVYSMPGYSTHTSQQACFASAEYLSQAVTCGSKSTPGYSWNSKQAFGNLQTGSGGAVYSERNDLTAGTAGFSNFEGSNSLIENAMDVGASAMPFYSKQHLSSSNFVGLAGKPLRKFQGSHLRSHTQPARVSYAYDQMDLIPSLCKQEPGGLSSSSRSIGQRVNGNNHSKMNEECNVWRNYKSSGDLVRGPRANRMNNSSVSSIEKTSSNCLFRREQFNKSDFQIQYEHAKFFMIKSYSEDDVHKSVKYNVWASTPNGNKKLDAAFRDAEMESKEKGTKCPIFLFFSVNASGQFLGLAEMVGPVDFKKTMDFWQQDKWNGFFPVIWHIIKDIPNRHFQSITLENNDNRAVTFSRDTQEIFLPQGLRMLFIFKGYPSGTSILDDFEFYENKGKSSCASRSRRPVSKHSEEFYDESTSMKHLESAFRKVGVSARPRNFTYPGTSVINHTSNLSWNDRRIPNRS